jgi:hypothetical protein
MLPLPSLRQNIQKCNKKFEVKHKFHKNFEKPVSTKTLIAAKEPIPGVSGQANRLPKFLMGWEEPLPQRSFKAPPTHFTSKFNRTVNK